jgi:hypothetical protein
VFVGLPHLRLVSGWGPVFPWSVPFQVSGALLAGHQGHGEAIVCIVLHRRQATRDGLLAPALALEDHGAQLPCGNPPKLG